MSAQLTLFKALKRINIDDEAATAVVDALRNEVGMNVADANKGIELQIASLKEVMLARFDANAKTLDALGSRVDSLDKQISRGFALVGFLVVVTGIAATLLANIAKLV